MPNDYTPNSRRMNEENKNDRPKVEKVVQGDVILKKNNKRKLAGMLISDEAHNLKSYVIMDVLLPKLKDIIEDIIVDSTRLILRGETATRRSSKPGDKISYGGFFKREDAPSRPREVTSRSSFYYDDIVLKNRTDAEAIIEQMEFMIDQYNQVTVNDLMDILGKSSNPTDCRYGWINLSTAKIVRTRDGYMLDLPRAVPLT